MRAYLTILMLGGVALLSTSSQAGDKNDAPEKKPPAAEPKAIRMIELNQRLNADEVAKTLRLLFGSTDRRDALRIAPFSSANMVIIHGGNKDIDTIIDFLEDLDRHVQAIAQRKSGVQK
jgi:hypothetical protein